MVCQSLFVVFYGIKHVSQAWQFSDKNGGKGEEEHK